LRVHTLADVTRPLLRNISFGVMKDNSQRMSRT